jgi:anti-sigma factor RsiW
MKSADMTPDPVTELLSSLLDGELTSEQREQLAHRLATDADARRRYLDFLLLDSRLQEELGDESLVGLVGGTDTASTAQSPDPCRHHAVAPGASASRSASPVAPSSCCSVC